jgi:hypothetical protein
LEERKMSIRDGRTQEREMTDTPADVNRQDVPERINQIGERIQSGMSDVNEKVRSAFRDVDFDETTIPDAFQRVPKLITPKLHAWLDVAVTTYFIGLGVWFAIRGKAGAATAAFVNGGMVAGVSLFTDYEGTGEKPIDFKMHGTLDAVQATTAAIGPVLHGFAGRPEAAFFYGQAANELAVIASTDWDAGMPKERRRKAA